MERMHDLIKKDGEYQMVDTCLIPYSGWWETAVAPFDEEQFKLGWRTIAEEGEDYTEDDILEYGEELDAFPCWNVIAEGMTKKQAIKFHDEYCA